MDDIVHFMFRLEIDAGSGRVTGSIPVVPTIYEKRYCFHSPFPDGALTLPSGEGIDVLSPSNFVIADIASRRRSAALV